MLNDSTPEPGARRWNPMWLRGALLLLILATLIWTSAKGLRGERAQKTDTSARLTLDSIVAARQLYLTRHGPLAGADKTATIERQVLTDLGKLVDASPSPTAVRQLAIMQYVAGDPAWAATLLRLPPVGDLARPYEIEREQDMWRKVFADGARGAEVGEIRGRIVGMRLGWYRFAALEALYQSSGMSAAAQEEEREALRSAYWQAAMLMLVVIAGLVGLALDLALLAVAYVRLRYAEDELPGPLRVVLRIDPPRRLPQRQAGFLYNVFLVYLGTFLVLRLALQEIVQRAGFHPTLREVSILTFAQYAVMIGLPAMLLLVGGRRVGLRAADIGLRTSSVWLDVLWGVGGYLAVLPPVWISMVISTKLFGSQPTPLNPAITQFATSHSILMQIILFAEAAVMAPVVEETMFRGVFFRSLSSRMTRGGALVLASAVFAILHPQLPLGFLSIFVLGAAFNTLYALRGSLVPNMVAHAINNGAIFVGLTIVLGS